MSVDRVSVIWATAPSSYNCPKILSIDDRIRTPLTEVLAARHVTEARLYSAALKDTRFSSSFGMYPSGYQPKKGASIVWVLFKFGFVGGLGLFLNQYVLFILTTLNGLSFLLFNAVVSSQVAILANFALNEVLVFRARNGSSVVHRMALFSLVSSADLVLRLPILWTLTSLLNVHWFWSNLDAIFLTFVVRFLISEKKIWGKTA